MGHIDYRHTPLRTTFLLPQDVTSLTGQWIYTLTGGYAFRAGIHDLYVHSLQRVTTNLFIRPSQVPIGPTGLPVVRALPTTIVRPTTHSLVCIHRTTCSISSVNILNVFDVVHSLDIVGLNMVPFDTYSLSALMIVIEKATNKSVPIITFAAGEGPDNFVVSSYDMWTKSNYTYDSGTGPTTVEVDSSVIQIGVKRSQLAQAFTMCLLIVSSALTIGSIYLMFLVIFGREGVDNAVLLLPVTIILTIPALRSLYPGSPPFGIYVG